MISSWAVCAGAVRGGGVGFELELGGWGAFFWGEELAFFAERNSLSALFAALVSRFCDLVASLASRVWASSKRPRWISNFCWWSSWSCCHWRLRMFSLWKERTLARALCSARSAWVARSFLEGYSADRLNSEVVAERRVDSLEYLSEEALIVWMEKERLIGFSAGKIATAGTLPIS